MPLHPPVLDEWNVYGATGSSRAHVEGPRSPEQGDPVGRVVSVQRGLFEEGLHKLGELKLLVVIRQWLLALLIPIQTQCRYCLTIFENPKEIHVITLGVVKVK